MSIFSTPTLFIANKFIKSLKIHKFARISYYLSIISYVIATLAITITAAGIQGFKELAKNDWLNFTPQVILNYQQSFANTRSQQINKYNYLRATKLILDNPELVKYLASIDIYAGGYNYYLKNASTLNEVGLFGVTTPDNQTKISLLPSGGDFSFSNPMANQFLANFKAGQFKIALPNSFSQAVEQVTIYNPDKVNYAPSGMVPVFRQFKVDGYFDYNGITLFANIFDVARINLQPQINQIQLKLRDPFAIDEFMPKLQQALRLVPNPELAYNFMAAKSAEQNSTTNPDSGLETNTRSKHNSIPSSESESTGTSVQEEPIQAEQAIELCSHSLADAAEPLYPSSAKDWRSQYTVKYKAIKNEAIVTNSLSWLLIVIAIISTLISFSFIIIEKDRDIAILNVMGMHKAKLRQVFILIVLRTLLIANLVSLALLALAYYYQGYFALIGINFKLEFSLLTAIRTYLLSSLIVFLSCLVAARFIVKIQPALVLK